AVWEAIRRTHGAPPGPVGPPHAPRALPCRRRLPDEKIWADRRGPSEPCLAGARARAALVLVGFVGALRRSELTALDVGQGAEHPNGVDLSLPLQDQPHRRSRRGDRAA